MTELDRILALPRVCSPAAPAGVLRPAQTAALRAWCDALAAKPDPVWGPPGGAYLLGCGHGKTLVSLLLPALASHPRTLHLVPAALLPQVRADLAAWTTTLPDLESPRRTFASHESLSAREGRRLFADLPELIVIDEAHGFGDPKSGRWLRLAAYLDERPGTRVAILSGTLSGRSLYQAQHLLVAALRSWAPVPRGPTIAPWAACVDAGAEATPADRAALEPLCQWAGESDPRAAFRTRLTTCPGVVVTGDAGAPTGLRVVAWRPAVDRPAAVEAAVRGLESAWALPDGTDLVSALEVHRHARTLSLGLFQRWVPETIDPDWLERRRAWASEARALVEYGGVATTLAEAADLAEAGRVRPSVRVAWLRWAEVRQQPGPETENVWLDGGLTVRSVAQAAVHGTPHAVVWTSTPAIGKAAARALGVRYAGAGDPAPTPGRTGVASIRVHGKGWNGQGFHRATILEPPSSGSAWEQLLARHHRQGQTEDVEFRVLNRDRVHYAALRTAVRDAKYVEETTGAAQRLLLCDCVGWTRDTGPDAARSSHKEVRRDHVRAE